MDKSVLEVIQKKVNILKFVRTHVRWAGIVAQFAGLFLHNNTIMLLGTFIFFMSYMVTTNIIEEITILVWSKDNEKEKDEDSTNKE